jgi:cardiolipin synthase (CMP-forming)
VSKLNTFAQIVLAGLVLAELGLGLGLEQLVLFLIPVTGALTILSAAAYFWGWLRHMASYEPNPAPLAARKGKSVPPLKGPEQSRARAS